jgi:hypothetical protein
MPTGRVPEAIPQSGCAPSEVLASSEAVALGEVLRSGLSVEQKGFRKNEEYSL